MIDHTGKRPTKSSTRKLVLWPSTILRSTLLVLSWITLLSLSVVELVEKWVLSDKLLLSCVERLSVDFRRIKREVCAAW